MKKIYVIINLLCLTQFNCNQSAAIHQPFFYKHFNKFIFQFDSLVSRPIPKGISYRVIRMPSPLAEDIAYFEVQIFKDGTLIMTRLFEQFNGTYRCKYDAGGTGEYILTKDQRIIEIIANGRILQFQYEIALHHPSIFLSQITIRRPNMDSCYYFTEQKQLKMPLNAALPSKTSWKEQATDSNIVKFNYENNQYKRCLYHNDSLLSCDNIENQTLYYWFN